ncbi:hypothetical protein OKW41_003069 [Paraburkholderia sp. UCT70]|uniref:hypothetical protein n=1 Tax=Paraburkholderia sp. UCT70 TaxID=2991068 RepID=UPI003D2546CE
MSAKSICTTILRAGDRHRRIVEPERRNADADDEPDRGDAERVGQPDESIIEDAEQRDDGEQHTGNLEDAHRARSPAWRRRKRVITVAPR